VADYRNNRVCVYPFDGGAMSKTWGKIADGESQFVFTLALVGRRLYVLRRDSRVQVYE